MKDSINSIETMGLVDGPGIRVVVFFNGCKLRCKYCHNPETWVCGSKNMSVDDVYNKIMRCEPYFKNNGGVTFSGGEPLLHQEFIIELSKKLKEKNIHLALDTAGVGNSNYDELLSYIDLVLLDIKHTNSEGYKYITGQDIKYQEEFINTLNRLNKKVWIRQVVVPTITDTREYILSLKEYLDKINNIERIDLLPYHTMALDKYKALGIEYPLKDIQAMDKEKIEELYKILKDK